MSVITVEKLQGAPVSPPPVAPQGAAKKPALPFSSKSAGAVGVALVLAGAGAAYIVAPKASESTDAAYVQADSPTVAPRVKGLVAEVLVQPNQAVRRGQPLVRIDPEEFDAKVASATADLAQARAAVAAARAALISLDAEEALAGSNVRAAQSLIAAADAESARAGADQARYDNLVRTGAVTRQEVERATTAAVAARSEADHTRATLDVSRDQAGVVRAKRATLAASLAEAQANEGRAAAALDLAHQDQGHSLVLAPMGGVVGDRQVEVGDYVQPGTRLLTLVPLGALYVTANFKETQIARMTVGQPAAIRVDALPGVTLKGEVESLAPGSGSQFSLLPFEPGTGNFTKIVQRVPVRIRIDPGQPGLNRLRPGLSSTVKVRLKG